MSKTIIIRLTTAGNRTSLFDIYDNLGNVLATDVTKTDIIDGYSVVVDDAITKIVLHAKGKCTNIVEVTITQMTLPQLAAVTYQPSNTASLWRHLTNILIFNTYYGNTEPYIIEYPFAYQGQDEILQNVKDYTRVYHYIATNDGVYDVNSKIETNDKYFNKAILYNGQQCSGLLRLVPKPRHNLNAYLSYPIYNSDSKTITVTKSDNFYQYNTFWSLIRDKSLPLFNQSCESLSIDKVLNQGNMDYGKRSFKKEPLRGKGLFVRHIMDDRSDISLISQMILAPSEISYK